MLPPGGWGSWYMGGYTCWVLGLADPATKLPKFLLKPIRGHNGRLGQRGEGVHPENGHEWTEGGGFAESGHPFIVTFLQRIFQKCSRIVWKSPGKSEPDTPGQGGRGSKIGQKHWKSFMDGPLCYQNLSCSKLTLLPPPMTALWTCLWLDCTSKQNENGWIHMNNRVDKAIKLESKKYNDH